MKTPLTGVFCTSSFDYIWDDIDFGIDLQLEEHFEECDLEDHEDCECWYDSQSHDALIGYKKNEKTGLYEPDVTAKYSAIYRGTDNIIQVTHSVWGILGAPCSPCYPNQVDGDTVGTLLGYSPPPDLIDTEIDRFNNNYNIGGYKKILKNRIFRLEEKGDNNE